ncbi:tRNA pseudouridine synthase B, partial [Frankliniella fusca]
MNFPHLVLFHVHIRLYEERCKDITPYKYFQHLMNYHDRRFAQHKTFRYYAYNSLLRWRALADGNIFVKNNPEFKDLTVAKLKEMINENPFVMKNIMYQASNIKGSKAYWYARAGELRDMVEQLTLPNLFLTLSCADHHWPDLFRLLTSTNIEDLSEFGRWKLVKKILKVKTFISEVLEKYYKVIDYWYRVEYQHRGSPHIHGLFWIENAPDVSNLDNMSEEYIQHVLDYYSELVTAINPIPDASSPDTHPCRRSYNVVEDFKQDLAELLHKVHRHTQCKPDSYFRIKKGSDVRQCRYGFPKPFPHQASLEKTEDGGWTFEPERDCDPRMNKYNQFIIQLWRANIDIAPVISKQALISYLVKYISKSEVNSNTLNELFCGAMEQLDEDDNVKKVLHKIYMKSCAERDISAQEVCHGLQGLPLCSAGKRKFIIVNLSLKKWLQIINDDDEIDKIGKSTIERYCERPHHLENLTLLEAAKSYDMLKWRRNCRDNIVRVFPRSNGIVGDEILDEKYYKSKILLHVHWRDHSTLKSDNESWKEVYHRNNLKTENDNNLSLNFEEQMDSEYDSEDDFNDAFEESEESMLVSRLAPNKIETSNISLGKRDVDLHYDWIASSKKHEEYGSIAEFESFIDCQKKHHAVQFSSDQQVVVAQLNSQIEKVKNNEIQNLKRILIQGKAGTGKSLIIKWAVKRKKG